jgi:hypothetical protein
LKPASEQREIIPSEMSGKRKPAASRRVNNKSPLKPATGQREIIPSEKSGNRKPRAPRRVNEKIPLEPAREQKKCMPNGDSGNCACGNDECPVEPARKQRKTTPRAKLGNRKQTACRRNNDNSPRKPGGDCTSRIPAETPRRQYESHCKTTDTESILLDLSLLASYPFYCLVFWVALDAYFPN